MTTVKKPNGVIAARYIWAQISVRRSSIKAKAAFAMANARAGHAIFSFAAVRVTAARKTSIAKKEIGVTSVWVRRTYAERKNHSAKVAHATGSVKAANAISCLVA